MIDPITSPLASVVDPMRATVKLRLLVTPVTLAICVAPLFENPTTSPIFN